MYDEAQAGAGEVAAIFVSRRTTGGPTGYAAASAAMETFAVAQPGYREGPNARGADGMRIMVGDRTDEAASVAWRGHPDHAAVRHQGRARWYEVLFAGVTRAYEWHRA
jgi:hypothetical protein